MSVKSLKYVLAISVVLVMSVVCHKVNADTNGLTEEVFSTYEVQPQYPGGEKL